MSFEKPFLPKDEPPYHKSFWLRQIKILGVIPTFGLALDFLLKAKGLSTFFWPKT
jgi:hypothetical protein